MAIWQTASPDDRRSPPAGSAAGSTPPGDRPAARGLAGPGAPAAAGRRRRPPARRCRVSGLKLPKGALGRCVGRCSGEPGARRALAGAGCAARSPTCSRPCDALGPAQSDQRTRSADADRDDAGERRRRRRPAAARSAAQLGPGRALIERGVPTRVYSVSASAASTPTPTSAAPSSGCSTELDAALDRVPRPAGRPPTAAARSSPPSTPSSAGG